jgi:hypothetical protein
MFRQSHFLVDNPQTNHNGYQGLFKKESFSFKKPSILSVSGMV